MEKVSEIVKYHEIPYWSAKSNLKFRLVTKIYADFFLLPINMPTFLILARMCADFIPVNSDIDLVITVFVFMTADFFCTD